MQLHILGILNGRAGIKPAVIKLGRQVLHLRFAAGQAVTVFQLLQDVFGQLIYKEVLEGFFFQGTFLDTEPLFHADGDDSQRQQQFFKTGIGYIQIVLMLHLQKQLSQKREIGFQAPFLIEETFVDIHFPVQGKDSAHGRLDNTDNHVPALLFSQAEQVAPVHGGIKGAVIPCQKGLDLFHVLQYSSPAHIEFFR